MKKTFWAFTIFLNDYKIGSIHFENEKIKDEFVNNYNELTKLKTNKWGCALLEYEVETNYEVN